VPVFISGLACWAEGVGEQLTPITPDEPWFVVLQPPCNVATAIIFNDPELTRDSQARTIARLVADDMDNDCAAVVFKRYPAVAEAAAWLSRYGRVRLTGTGACLFAAFNERYLAEQVYAELPKGWQGFVSRGCNRSLLLERLEHEKIASY
jgi:4-diphosphocytidyl-2-C-methyl-D-erythritol kinase